MKRNPWQPRRSGIKQLACPSGKVEATRKEGHIEDPRLQDGRFTTWTGFQLEQVEQLIGSLRDFLGKRAPRQLKQFSTLGYWFGRKLQLPVNLLQLQLGIEAPPQFRRTCCEHVTAYFRALTFRAFMFASRHEH